MAGIATVTMLPSRTVISSPVAITPRAIQRERDGVDTDVDMWSSCGRCRQERP
ncbi:hypothetical protein ACFQZ4_12825 [Catellatospora coxensis]